MGVIYAKYINSEKNKKSRWHNLKVFRLFFFFKFSLLFSWLLLLKFRCTSHFSSPRLHKPDVHEPFKTHHQCRWQPLWNCTYAYFSYVGANSCDSTKTKIYSNEGGLTILSLMHVLHSDCLLSHQYTVEACKSNYSTAHLRLFTGRPRSRFIII